MTLLDGSLIFFTPGTAESLAALPGVVRLAAATNNQLAVVHLVDHADDRTDDDRRVAAAVAALGADQSPGVLTVLSDNLPAALATFRAMKSRMLALQPSRRGGLLRLFAGNDDELLLRRQPTPVLALPAAGALTPIRRLLFPLDFAPRSDAAFETTLDLCRVLGAELHLLHVFGDDVLLPAEQDAARRGATKTVRELLRLDQEQLQHYHDRATARDLPVHSGTAEGRAHAAINAYVAGNAIDLVVMATHGPRTAEDILLGSTTARAIRAASVPVLAIPA